MTHPPYDCENCGVYHMSYSGVIAYTNREISKRMSLFGILFTMAFVSLVIVTIIYLQHESEPSLIGFSSFDSIPEKIDSWNLQKWSHEIFTNEKGEQINAITVCVNNLCSYKTVGNIEEYEEQVKILTAISNLQSDQTVKENRD